MTKADDGVISQAELGKVGGIFNNKQKMILFLEMSTSKLSQTEKDSIISKLDDRLQKSYQKFKPQRLLPSEASTKGVVSSNAIITGIPRFVDSKSDFNGFIMIPIISNNVTTFMMIPIIDRYDIYELRDEESSEYFLIAHSKESEKLTDKKITLGGVLKELKTDEEDDKGRIFLEIIYRLEG
jgi:hypothetical protein